MCRLLVSFVYICIVDLEIQLSSGEDICYDFLKLNVYFRVLLFYCVKLLQSLREDNDIAEILLKAALSKINQIKSIYSLLFIGHTAL
jgi:hypothetical protein